MLVELEKIKNIIKNTIYDIKNSKKEERDGLWYIHLTGQENALDSLLDMLEEEFDRSKNDV